MPKDNDLPGSLIPLPEVVQFEVDRAKQTAVISGMLQQAVREVLMDELKEEVRKALKNYKGR